MVEEAFRLGWFQIPGADRLPITLRRTRPSTPFGDAVFIFIIAECTANVASQLGQEGLLLQVPKPSADLCFRNDPPLHG